MPLNGRPGPQALIPASRARLVKSTSSQPCWSWVCELSLVERLKEITRGLRLRQREKSGMYPRLIISPFSRGRLNAVQCLHLVKA